jgi:hypothetical protein
VGPAEFLDRMLVCYLLTVAVETAVLMVGLPPRHRAWERLFAGAWLTACTYPIVWLVLPPLIPDRGAYLFVAETFAPFAEACLYWLAFVRGRAPDGRATARGVAAVVAANVTSFAAGEGHRAVGWLDFSAGG